MDLRIIMKVDWTKQGNCLDMDRIRLRERSKNDCGFKTDDDAILRIQKNNNSRT